jgi:hypothetical protein
MNAVQKTIGNLSSGTISTWFRLDHDPGNMEIDTILFLGDGDSYSSYGTTTDSYQLELGHFSAQRRLYWTLLSTEVDNTDIPLCWATTNHLNNNRWYHIVCTVSEKEGTHVYLDNVEIYDPSVLTWNFGDETMCKFLSDVRTQNALWFGRGLWNNEIQYYEGAIDEFRIWDYAITPEEVEIEYERSASVGSLEISNEIPSEIIVADDVEFSGTVSNIVELSWRIDSISDWVVQDVETIDPAWTIIVPNQAIPAGRHTVTVRGRNAARRSFLESRTVIQPDMNGDDLVNVDDLLTVIAAWGDCDCNEDLTGDGNVGVHDILLLIAAWS